MYENSRRFIYFWQKYKLIIKRSKTSCNNDSGPWHHGKYQGNIIEQSCLRVIFLRNPTISTRIYLQTHQYIKCTNISTSQSTGLNCLGLVYLPLSSLSYTPPFSPIFLVDHIYQIFDTSNLSSWNASHRRPGDVCSEYPGSVLASMCIYQSICNSITLLLLYENVTYMHTVLPCSEITTIKLK